METEDIEDLQDEEAALAARQDAEPTMDWEDYLAGRDERDKD